MGSQNLSLIRYWLTFIDARQYEKKLIMATGKAVIASVKIDDYIRAHYPTTHAKVIADVFGLRAKWVQNRAWQLNVKKEKEAAKRVVEEAVRKPKATKVNEYTMRYTWA